MIHPSGYELISKEEAAWLGLKHYFTGKKCRRGHSAMRLVSTKNCIQCIREYNSENRERLREASRARWAKLAPDKRERKAAWHRKWHHSKPAKKMLFGARSRAKEQGVPFSLLESDIVIPSVCPVLGIPLSKGNGKLHAGSPTIDRLEPSRGYVPDNIRIISHRANRIKQDATADELEAVLFWLRRAVP